MTTPAVQPPAQCRYCSCTNESPCSLGHGEECAWMTDARDVCSHPRCLRLWLADGRRAVAQARFDLNQRRRDLAAAVAPITRRLIEQKRLRREARRNRNRTLKGRAA